MQDILENTGNTIPVSQQSGLMSMIFREYRNHFGLFWRVMLPIIVFSLILNIGGFFLFKLAVPEAAWTFSTSGGIKLQPSSGSLQPSPEPTSVNTGVGFNGSFFHIGLLWLAMCPLALIIVYHRRGVDVTFGEVWRHTRRKAGSILIGSVLILALVASVSLITLPIVFLMDERSVGFPGAMFLFILIPSLPITYFLVKWSLYNQGIIIENLSTIAAFRRSSALVQGKWGQFFGMYLLLVLGAMIFTTAAFSLTLLLFSVVTPELAPLREVLQSGKFFGFFFGGYIAITLDSAPAWAISGMVAVKTLIDTLLAPIWALLTTHLYMERTGTQQNAVSS